MSHDHADTTAADALDALQSRFAAQEAELMRNTALVDSYGQRFVDLTATVKAMASSPALAVSHAKFARDLQAFKDEATRSANAEAEKTLQGERKAAYARQRADVRTQVDVELRKHRNVWMGSSFLAGLVAAWMCAAYMQGGTKLAIWATGEANGWEAGSHLIRSTDPAGWNKLADLWAEVQKQEAAARACKNPDVFGINAAACAVTPPKQAKP
jgi:hypothetical protein